MTQHTELELVIYGMLTENTGAHMLDSGGAYGRAWQRNAGKTIEDFKAANEATLELSIHAGQQRPAGEPFAELTINVDLFHKLSGRASPLELDDHCRAFNSLDVNDWDGEYWGVAAEGRKYLEANGFYIDTDGGYADKHGDSGFNTYNWDCCFSQIIQGVFISQETHDDIYVLLQVHGGCDARGGYTDAKLFKVNTAFQEHYVLLRDDASFSVKNPAFIEPEDVTSQSEPREPEYLTIDYRGGQEFTTAEDYPLDNEGFLKFAFAAGCKINGESVSVAGGIFE